MVKSYSNIYLSGWEYNRLLSKDPTEPRISALPAEILWNGAAPLRACLRHQGVPRQRS